MSASATRAQVLAAALPPPVLPAAQATVSPAVTPAMAGLQASAAAPAQTGAPAATAAVAPTSVPPTSEASTTVPPKTAAQAFAQAPIATTPANATNATNTQDADAHTSAPAVAGRPGTVATVAKPAMPAMKSPADAGSIGGAVASLVLVIGLILGLGWLAKRLPGFRGAGNAGNALRVVSSLSLGPRERVVVVAVGETQLLIGVGAGGMRTLHTLEQPLPVAPATAAPAFAQLLAQHFGKKA